MLNAVNSTSGPSFKGIYPVRLPENKTLRDQVLKMAKEKTTAESPVSEVLDFNGIHYLTFFTGEDAKFKEKNKGNSRAIRNYVQTENPSIIDIKEGPGLDRHRGLNARAAILLSTDSPGENGKITTEKLEKTLGKETPGRSTLEENIDSEMLILDMS